MNVLQVRMEMIWPFVFMVYFVNITLGIQAREAAYISDGLVFSELSPHIVTSDHNRHKRDTQPALSPIPPSPAMTASPASAPSPLPALPVPTPASAIPPSTSPNVTDANRTTNLTKPTATPVTAVVTQVPKLGVNGTGQRWQNMTDTITKVSDPISADDNLTNVFETPERIKAERHLANLTYDHHSFYNSSFIGDKQYFSDYWANITKPTADVHGMLSNSYRRATTVKLSFEFPFYGNWIRNITVATGGFIYTGEHTHAWLAATQYIAPLMANFDTSLSNDSAVKLSDDGEKFTAFWENVTLHDQPTKRFFFAVTLHKNGDIVFAYKDIPMPVKDINDREHPVKIGISDAYLTDKIIFYVRRKTIYEYHRVSFKNYEITNNTILKLTALPTCLEYTSCDSCLNHNTGFDCSWCETIQKCSSGTDRNKQDWQLRNCDKTQVTNASQCPANLNATTPAPAHLPAKANDTSTTYETDSHGNPYHDAVVKPMPTVENKPKESSASVPSNETTQVLKQVSVPEGGGSGGRHAVGGAAAALAAVALVCAAAGWALYAFKNPHTRSGQLLIKYRPSQWNWRRGEARYTAATIHM
ncbi:hypothetical protein ACJJTC_000575 [Scirpophaga incertulas]